MIGSLLGRIRCWLGRPGPERRSFDDLLREACDEPMMALSAQALIQSLSTPPARGSNFNRDDRRHSEAIRFQEQLR